MLTVPSASTDSSPWLSRWVGCAAGPAAAVRAQFRESKIRQLSRLQRSCRQYRFGPKVPEPAGVEHEVVVAQLPPIVSVPCWMYAARLASTCLSRFQASPSESLKDSIVSATRNDSEAIRRTLRTSPWSPRM